MRGLGTPLQRRLTPPACGGSEFGRGLISLVSLAVLVVIAFASRPSLSVAGDGDGVPGPRFKPLEASTPTLRVVPPAAPVDSSGVPQDPLPQLAADPVVPPPPVPNTVHFVYTPRVPRLSIWPYLAVLAARVNLAPDVIRWHHTSLLPTGPWWECARELLSLHVVPDVVAIHGRPMNLSAVHKSDITRFEVLLAEGGVYLDTDTLALRDLSDLLALDVTTLGRLDDNRDSPIYRYVTNAMVVAPVGAPFLQRWYANYSSFDPKNYDHHQCWVAADIADDFPSEVNVLPADALFLRAWWHMPSLFQSDDCVDWSRARFVHGADSQSMQSRENHYAAHKRYRASVESIEDVWRGLGSMHRVARNILRKAAAAGILRDTCPAAALEVARLDALSHHPSLSSGWLCASDAMTGGPPALPPPAALVPDASCAVNTAFLTDWDWPGVHDLRSEPAEGAADCCRACVRDSACATWVWKREGAQCYLKSAPEGATGASRAEGLVLGVVRSSGVSTAAQGPVLLPPAAAAAAANAESLDLESILADERRLQFDDFTNAEGIKLGLALLNAAQTRSLIVAVEVQLINGLSVFHGALDGAQPLFDEFAARKVRTVVRWQHASLFLSRTLARSGRSFVEEFGIEEGTAYTRFGGGFPIAVRGAGIVGAVSVSGLSEEEDHRLVIETLSALLFPVHDGLSKGGSGSDSSVSDAPVLIPVVPLRNAADEGVTFPLTGLGTGGYTSSNASGYGGYPECWSSSRGGCGEWVYRATSAYIKLAARLSHAQVRIDSAAFYDNQREVGAAIAKSGVPRKRIFLVSKIGHQPAPMGFADTLAQVDAILAAMEVAYLDLLLIHWPTSKGVSQDPACNAGSPAHNATACRLDTWRALRDVWSSGRARAIGVCNYGVAELLEFEAAGVPLPAVNQLPVNIYRSRASSQGVWDWCARHGIVVNAYSPLGVPDAHTFPGTNGMASTPMLDPVVVAAAAAHGRSPAQVLANWVGVALGMPLTQRSQRVEHMEENLRAFDFALTADEVEQLSARPQGTCDVDPRWYECGTLDAPLLS